MVDAEVQHHLFARTGRVAEVCVATFEVIGFPANFDLLIRGYFLNGVIRGRFGHRFSPVSSGIAWRLKYVPPPAYHKQVIAHSNFTAPMMKDPRAGQRFASSRARAAPSASVCRKSKGKIS